MTNQDRVHILALKLWGMSASGAVIEDARNLQEAGMGFDAAIAIESAIGTMIAFVISETKGHDMDDRQAEVIEMVNQLFETGAAMGVSAALTDKDKADVKQSLKETDEFLAKFLKGGI